MGHYEKAWQDARQRIAARCARRGPRPRYRPPARRFEDVPAGGRSRGSRAGPARVRRELRAGSRAQKRADLADLPDIEWHLIGPLQSNKARAAARAFDWVETRRPAEDRRAACRRRARRRCRPSTCCVQVNVSGEATKSGVAPGEAVGAGDGASRRCRGCVARHHGHSRADRRRRAAARRSSASCARASTRAARRGSPSTRCRWACRRTSKRRSPRARRRCASAPRSSARATLSADAANRMRNDVHRRRQHGDAR